MREVVLIAALALTSAFVSACGGAATGGGEVSGNSLTVYSSQPLLGPDADAGNSIARGEKLALRDAEGKVGKYSINFISLDDSTQTVKGARPAEVGYDLEAIGANATKAGQDTKTIAYIGDFSSAATAAAIPIINEAGILQVAPAGGAVGLTKKIPGAGDGEPDVFYPSGERTFARVAPPDDLQATAAANWARDLGAKQISTLSDASGFGGMTRVFADAVKERNIKVSEEAIANFSPQEVDRALKAIRAQDPDLIYFGAAQSTKLAKLMVQVHTELPQVKLMVPENMQSEPGFTDNLGTAAGSTYMTGAVQDARQLPKPGREFVAVYKRRYGESPNPYAVYGYSAMQVVLEAIKRADKKGNDRQSVINEIYEDDKKFETAIGAIQFDDNGDPNLKTVPGYRVSDGNLKFAQSLQGTVSD